MESLKNHVKRITGLPINAYEEKQKKPNKIHNNAKVTGCCGNSSNSSEENKYKNDENHFSECPNSLYLASIRFTV